MGKMRKIDLSYNQSDYILKKERKLSTVSSVLLFGAQLATLKPRQCDRWYCLLEFSLSEGFREPREGLSTLT